MAKVADEDPYRHADLGGLSWDAERRSVATFGARLVAGAPSTP